MRYKCNVDASFFHALNKVRFDMCVCDEEGRFVLAKTEWMAPLHDVDLWEVLGLLLALRWVRDLQLGSVDFELDFKTVVDSLHESKNGVSNYSAMINDCRRVFVSDLAFIKRTTNKIVHSLTKVAPSHSKVHLNTYDICHRSFGSLLVTWNRVVSATVVDFGVRFCRFDCS